MGKETFYGVSLEWEYKTHFVFDEVMKMNYTTNITA